MVHDEYKEMIPAQALSALDSVEERELEEHLAECADCRRDLAEWQATAASLAMNADPAEPSSDVRDKILNQIKSPSNVLPLQRPQRNLRNSLALIAAAVL